MSGCKLQYDMRRLEIYGTQNYNEYDNSLLPLKGKYLMEVFLCIIANGG